MSRSLTLYQRLRDVLMLILPFCEVRGCSLPVNFRGCGLICAPKVLIASIGQVSAQDGVAEP